MRSEVVGYNVNLRHFGTKHSTYTIAKIAPPLNESSAGFEGVIVGAKPQAYLLKSTRVCKAK